MNKPKRIRFQVRDGGKKKSVYFDSKKERDEFRKALNQQRLKEKYLNHDLVETTYTLRDYTSIWLTRRENEVAEKSLTYAGFRKYEEILRLHILSTVLDGARPDEKFGDTPLIKIKTRTVDALLQAIAKDRKVTFQSFDRETGEPVSVTKELKGLGPASRNRVRATLRSLLQDAFLKEYIPRNPVDAIPQENEIAARPKVKILSSKEDIETWLTEADKFGPMVYALECTLLNGGLREAQSIPLRWKDYLEPQDRAHRRMWIGRIFEKCSGLIVNRTKGRDDTYYVGVNDAWAEALEAWRAASPHTKPDDFIFLASSRKNKGKTVIQHFKHAHIGPHTIHRIHNLIRRITKLDITGHEKRHTYGSQLSAASGIQHAQEQLGHTSIKTTEEYYKHAVKTEAGARANAVNFRRKGGS